MLDKEIRMAVLTLRGKDCGIRKIAKELEISRNSVRSVIHSGADQAGGERGSQLDAYLEDIRVLYATCEDKRKGRANLVRVREKLKDLLEQRGEKLTASYSALTWFCREHGLGVVEKEPTRHIRTAPGEEMQHDTSPYIIKLGGKKVSRQCASLVFGYSRMSYVQFYPNFDRFQCKIFLTDAFRYLEGTCRRCVIDNTSVILACGAGQMAQVAPEVEAFEKRFGFRFMAHEIMDCNRKGKVERPFD